MPENIASSRLIATTNQGTLTADDLGIRVDSKLVEKKLSKLEQFITKPQVDPLKKVRSIYRFADWLVEHSGVVKAAVCKRGCTHCCYLDVDVSLLEAAFIAKHTSYTQVYRTQRIRKGYHESRTYCGFLDQQSGSCTIYDVRPMACRTFFAFDSPELCDRDNGTTEHAIFTSNDHGVLKHFRNQLIATSDGRYADIREWFQEITSDPYEQVMSDDLEFSYR